MLDKIRRLAYACLAVSGVLHALAPRLSLRLAAKTWLMGFENTENIESKDWLATAMRAAGIGMAAAGLAGFLLEGSTSDEDAEDAAPIEIDPESSDDESPA